MIYWSSFVFMTKQVSFDFGSLMFAWIISPSLIACPHKRLGDFSYIPTPM
jgi:hypothetical protein